ncbi:MAG: anthranilate phosphoribosyltransferase [Omnitrophica WOR_2 bacterium GWF2_43_52]|nr:MAG: anthranilate phosphoribosyltransferase [Omnitrophica WOR_2 bacterium GWF2_43_52]OGX55971.1 MAG: anthranilate phosphoribosyltransferase [Omnitrophica WOR_2 bacterium RIFOXYC2_FULL_43_9]HAH19593.1 anthranilate phosphoribosyltransferase [Candidatus Omnitrophota bacterium]HBG62762.1 anthranilate phosphoribosyltransferase [Candidatus Omnitrophota bacterium]HCD39097.1 anthranilate phosphoribosyltransferase [Candidatus Omnitrophota bacterium]
MIKEAIAQLVERKNLTRNQMKEAVEEIMRGQTSPAQIAAFLTALRMKGETVDEITGAAIAMREFVKKITIDEDVILDTCGTGADRMHTFNISTVSAFVAAGSGVVVAKHGNRAISSRSGSADLLEALGVNINIDEQKVEACLKKIGIGFLFAQTLHPAMKNVAPVRKELGIRTIFNVLGPLTNPAFATHQLLGVYDPALLRVVAKVLGNVGVKHAMVVHGDDGLDEITTTTSTHVCELKKGTVRCYTMSPGDFKIKKARLKDLEGGNSEDNARIAASILQGEKGAKRDIVLFNSGCAIYVADKARSIKEGIERAKESIDSGRALRKLEELKEITNK